MAGDVNGGGGGCCECWRVVGTIEECDRCYDDKGKESGAQTVTAWEDHPGPKRG